METFTKPRKLVNNPRFELERERALKSLSLESIDAPIRDIVEGFAIMPYCFTLQSCFGHFVYTVQPALENFEPLPAHDVGAITYRIAYVALCLQNNAQGERLLSSLAEIPALDPEYVQFGSPDWFWDRQLNSFALQVEPVRFAYQDQAAIDHAEALHVQKVRDQFFVCLGKIIRSQQNGRGSV
jgi:hypothetical protein